MTTPNPTWGAAPDDDQTRVIPTVGQPGTPEGHADPQPTGTRAGAGTGTGTDTDTDTDEPVGSPWSSTHEPSAPAQPGSTDGPDAARRPSTVWESDSSMGAPPSTPPAAPITTRHRGARMGTVVWGMLLAALGAGIVARGLRVDFDTELALIVVLCLMGGALLIGSLVAVVRRS